MPLTKEEVDQIAEELLEDCHFLKRIIQDLFRQLSSKKG